MKCDTAHGAFVEMCLNLNNEGSWLIPFDDESFFKPWKFSIEYDVDHCSTYGEDPPSTLCHRNDRLSLQLASVGRVGHFVRCRLATVLPYFS